MGACSRFNKPGLCFFNAASMTEAEQFLANLSNPFPGEVVSEVEISTLLTAAGADLQ